MLTSSTGVLGYLLHITKALNIYAPFSYAFLLFLIFSFTGFAIGIRRIIKNFSNLQKILELRENVNSHVKNSIENKLIILDNATKIHIFSKNGKDYCVVKLHIFNCSDEIIRATTVKNSTWIMIKSNEKDFRSKDPLEYYYFPELFLPYDYNNAIQSPPIEIDLKNESKAIEISLSLVLNYSINSDTNQYYKLEYLYNKVYDIFPESILHEDALSE